jgi:hypothetical protein
MAMTQCQETITNRREPSSQGHRQPDRPTVAEPSDAQSRQVQAAADGQPSDRSFPAQAHLEGGKQCCVVIKVVQRCDLRAKASAMAIPIEVVGTFESRFGSHQRA